MEVVNVRGESFSVVMKSLPNLPQWPIKTKKRSQLANDTQNNSNKKQPAAQENARDQIAIISDKLRARKREFPRPLTKRIEQNNTVADYVAFPTQLSTPLSSRWCFVENTCDKNVSCECVVAGTLCFRRNTRSQKVRCVAFSCRLLKECKKLRFLDVSFCSQLSKEFVENLRSMYPDVSIKKSFVTDDPFWYVRPDTGLTL